MQGWPSGDCVLSDWGLPDRRGHRFPVRQALSGKPQVAVGWDSHRGGCDAILASNALDCTSTVADGIRAAATESANLAAVSKEDYPSCFGNGFACDADSDRCDR